MIRICWMSLLICILCGCGGSGNTNTNRTSKFKEGDLVLHKLGPKGIVKYVNLNGSYDVRFFDNKKNSKYLFEDMLHIKDYELEPYNPPSENNSTK